MNSSVIPNMPNLDGLLYAPTKPFSGFKVAPCKMIGPDQIERCEPNEEADFWGLYSRVLVEGAEVDDWIADFQTEAQANAFREFLESVVSNHTKNI